ncbi:MAG TPA: DivIVA domain-containing protein [Acidimicrobiales bacterium]|jgi:DivIVA domain-containing protein|nr:DivIVA domain-containing protein [Acidimicrobiales bacterium]
MGNPSDTETATDLEGRAFTIVRRGYDPDEVRAFLQELIAAGLRPSPVFELVGEKVAELLETAYRTSESIEAQAREDAERMRAECDQLRANAEAAAAVVREDAERCRADAQVAVAEAAAKASQIVADAEAIADNVTAEADRLAADRVAAAEDHARHRANIIIANAKRRLRKVLDAEREVHARMCAALANLDADADEPPDGEDEELLDQAFAEFFADDVETEPSRSWILSE